MFPNVVIFLLDSRKPSHKKHGSKYSQLKKLSGKSKPRYRDHPPHHPRNKQIRPPLPPPRPTHAHKPHKVNPKQIRPNLRQTTKNVPEPAQRRDSSYGAPPAPQPKVKLLFIELTREPNNKMIIECSTNYHYKFW